MRYAILSDIHANLEALEAVLADIDKQHVDRVICLGDIVGYGADPEKCMRLVEKNCDFILFGNHEYAVLTGHTFAFSDGAKDSIDWTRKRLRTGLKFWRWLDHMLGLDYMQVLAQLPEKHQEGDVLYVHGSPRDTISDYLHTEVVDAFLSRYELSGNRKWLGEDPKDVLDSSFENIDWLCFNGHSHFPGIIFQLTDIRKKFTIEAKSGPIIIDRQYGYVLPKELKKEGIYDLTKARGIAKVVLGVGAVGQPRDKDPRACYVLFDGETVRYRRVVYDQPKASAKIAGVKQLDDLYAIRLAEGI